MTENRRGCLVPPHTTLGGVRGGSNAAWRQDIQIPAARQARERLGAGLRAVQADHIAESDEISLRNQ